MTFADIRVRARSEKIAQPVCVRERGEIKITKSPLRFPMTSWKAMSIATPCADNRSRLSDPAPSVYRSLPIPHQGGETRGFLYL